MIAELYGSNDIKKRMSELAQAGKIREVNNKDTDNLTRDLKQKKRCQSDDEHIIALAIISGARLLYSNDKKLHKDFKNKSLIDNPRGKVYSTAIKKEFTEDHSNLLARTDLCKVLQ